MKHPSIMQLPAPTKQVKEALEQAMLRSGDEVADHAKMTRLQISMDVVSLLAAKGVRWAVDFVRDSLDGKPTQEVVGQVHNTLTVEKLINFSGLSTEQLTQLESLALTLQQGSAIEAPARDREGEV